MKTIKILIESDKSALEQQINELIKEGWYCPDNIEISVNEHGICLCATLKR